VGGVCNAATEVTRGAPVSVGNEIRPPKAVHKVIIYPSHSSLNDPKR
jgi:hypothetical protein